MAGAFQADSFQSGAFQVDAVLSTPNVKVEIAFGTAPLTVPGTWTDVSAYVRSIDISRGRDHELSQSRAGECVISLTNTDRRFDPLHATGPYFGQLLPMRQVRVIATSNGVDYPLFYGYIEDWSQTWPGRPISAAGDAECVVHAVDGFKLLGLYQIPNTYSAEVQADNPSAYYRMDEPVESTQVESIVIDGGSVSTNKKGNLVTSGASRSIAGVGGGRFGVPGPLVGGATAFRGVDQSGLTGPVPLRLPAAGTTNTPTMEFWIYLEGLPAGVGGIISNGALENAQFGSMALVLSAAGQFSHFWGLSTDAGVTDSSWTLSVGAWTHVAFVHDGPVIRFYRNGVAVGPPVVSTTQTVTEPTVLNVGSTQVTSEAIYARLAHVAVYDYPLPAVRIAAHYAATLGAIAAGKAGAQIGVLLDQMGWPASLRSIDTGVSTMVQFDPVGSALGHMLEIAENSEQGLLQMSADGKVVFHDRASMDAITGSHGVSQATFGDAGAEEPYADLQLRYDDQDLYSRVVATRDKGAPQLATDATSLAAYGPRTLTRSVPRLSTDEEAFSAANYLLRRYKEPAVRPSSVTLALGSDVSMNAAVLSRETHHDRVTVVRRPQGGGSAISFEAHVEGLSYDIDPVGAWGAKLSLVPTTTFWVLEDAVLGLLGSTTYLYW